MGQWWWVNQGQTFREERRAGLLWAPQRASDGSTRSYWTSMTQVAVGDTVVHYADGEIRSLSHVTAAAVVAPRPADLPADMWQREGWLVRCAYRDLAHPIRLGEIPLEWRQGKGGPFKVDGGVKQAYLFALSDSFVADFRGRFGDRLPAGPEPNPPHVLPPEARWPAVELARRLIGEDLRTSQGQPNRIIGVHGNSILVATDRSPEGQPVPVAELESALEILRTDGEVRVTPEVLGHRSSFLGAVLATLPGARRLDDPDRITLRPPATPGEVSVAAGELDVSITTTARREQPQLRRRLIAGATRLPCDLCGRTFPTEMLVAAHIKKRAVCSSEERRDLANVAMLACKFGCDDLFELGYITVDKEGRIRGCATSDRLAGTVATYVERLTGRPCGRFGVGSRTYFAWHRDNVFLGGKG